MLDVIRRSFTLRILIPMVFLLVLVLGGFGFFQVRALWKQGVTYLSNNAYHQSVTLMAALKNAMLQSDASSIETMLADLRGKNDITEIDITNDQGKITWTSDQASAGKTAPWMGQVSEHEEGYESLTKDRNGSYTLLSVVPIRNEASCYACHAPEQKNLGYLSMRLSADEDVQAVRRAVKRDVFIFGGLIAALCGLVFLLLTILVTRPLSAILRTALLVAKGDFTQEQIAVSSHDEIGEMAQMFNRTMSQLNTLAGRITASTRSMLAASDQLNVISRDMSGNAEQTSNQAHLVSQSAEEVSRMIQSSAGAVDGVNLGIRDAARNVSEAANVANSAVGVVKSVSDQMARLEESTAEISGVIKMINSVAEQTNLLALNATIEAARAGEVGKGFAVVASEVKELARQTAGATEAVRKRIEAIQGVSRDSIEAIKRVRGIIERINELQTAVAGSVEQQAASIADITRSSSEAAKANSQITQNIGSVAQAAAATTAGAKKTEAAAAELARLASELQEFVSRFKS